MVPSTVAGRRWPVGLLPGWLRRRPGSAVLTGVLLVAALGASLAAGYTVAHPLLSSGGADVAKGDGIAHLNGESGTVEAEALALATGRHPIEVVTLHDGTVAAVDKKAHQVKVIPTPEWGSPQPPVISSAGSLSVVAGPDRGYVLDTARHRVQPLEPGGQQPAPVSLPAAPAGGVPDATAGIWVRTEDGRVVRVVGNTVTPVQDLEPVIGLTTAGDRPIALTSTHQLYDISVAPPRKVSPEQVALGPDDGLHVGSWQGAGRWVTIVDERNHQLVVADPLTGRVSRTELPADATALGEPVQAGDVVYVPDYAGHRLLPYRLPGGAADLQPVSSPVHVPGRTGTFSVEVRDGRVWANDQFDRRTLVIGADGLPSLVDKGPGPEVDTDTDNPDRHRNEATGPRSPAGPQSPTSPQPPTGPRLPTAPPTTPRTSQPPAVPTRPLPGTQLPTSPPGAPTTSPPATPAARVRVPGIPVGTEVNLACQQVLQAGLFCEPVAAGEGSPVNTVVDISPPAGTLVDPGSHVRVRYYSQAQPVVPKVIGLPVDTACSIMVSAGLTCTKATTSGQLVDELGLVLQQTPDASTSVATGTQVTLTYADTVPMPDYLLRPSAQDVCTEIQQMTQNQVTCQVGTGGTTLATGLPAGSVDSQNPAAGTPIAIGQTVTVNAVVESKRVPDLTNMSLTDANNALAAAGYTPDARPDALSRSPNTVASQDTTPGTPQDGGTVVYHYSNVTPVGINLYTNSFDVWVMRLATTPAPPGYNFAGLLGYAYPPDTPLPVASGNVYSYQCNGGATCGIYTPNHYYSRDTVPKAGWVSNGPVLTIFNATPGGGCPAAGQTTLYRNWYDLPGGRAYRLEYSTADWSRTELLGCIWSPP
jgi:beta-lactam-binding protein with PASTA domain